MKKAFLLTIVSLMMATALWAESGRDCYTAIPIGKDPNFSYDVPIASELSPKSVWFSAWTFDLPLSVYFAPANGEDDPAPEVEMDFTCKPGVYTDSILCSLFCKNGGSSGIEFEMPHRPSLSKTTKDGVFMYYLSLGKKYRDLLLQMGISYNLEVYVKVTFKCKGVLKLAPDDFFTNCMDGPKFMRFGDTVKVVPLDKERHVIVPYVQWQDDSIRYIWEGEKSCYVTVASECDYDPTKGGDDERILDILPLKAGKDTVKVTSKAIRDYVQFADNQAGMFFAKCYAQSAGVLKIERVPMAPPKRGATVLRYDKQSLLTEHDTALFAIPKSWIKDTIQFITPTHHVFRMYLSTNPEFTAETAERIYQFDPFADGHKQGIFPQELEALWNKTSDNYLYVHFDCSEGTYVTPSIWKPSECVQKAHLISGDTLLTVPREDGTIYRFYYPKWSRGNMHLLLTQNGGKCLMVISGKCVILASTSDPDKITYRNLSPNVEMIIKSEVMQDETWVNAIDEEGYFYVRFNSTMSGGAKVKITSDAPAETDPTYPSSTIQIACEGTQVIVSVSVAQHITVFNAASEVQDEWDAEIGVPHVFNLSAGSYILQGEKEKITIKL